MASIAKSEPEKKLLGLCETVLRPRGFRTVDVDFHLAGRSIIRIFVEKAEGQGTSIADCAEASRMLGPVFDVEPAIPGPYDLEVSSPGLERRLRLDQDFAEVVGEEIKLKLVERMESVGANVTGRLERVENDVLVMTVSGQLVFVPISNIKRAHRVWRFEKRQLDK